jgi:uncharacterized protein HemX
MSGSKRASTAEAEMAFVVLPAANKWQAMPTAVGNHTSPKIQSHSGQTMKKFIAALTITLPLCIGAMAASAEEKAAPTQQSKMATCNKEAGDKKGDERKAFMSECLSNKQARQQDKMKTCNKDAEGKKGDERKAFMSECLKK